MKEKIEIHLMRILNIEAKNIQKYKNSKMTNNSEKKVKKKQERKVQNYEKCYWGNTPTCNLLRIYEQNSVSLL